MNVWSVWDQTPGSVDKGPVMGMAHQAYTGVRVNGDGDRILGFSSKYRIEFTRTGAVLYVKALCSQGARVPLKDSVGLSFVIAGRAPSDAIAGVLWGRVISVWHQDTGDLLWSVEIDAAEDAVINGLAVWMNHVIAVTYSSQIAVYNALLSKWQTWPVTASCVKFAGASHTPILLLATPAGPVQICINSNTQLPLPDEANCLALDAMITSERCEMAVADEDTVTFYLNGKRSAQVPGTKVQLATSKAGTRAVVATARELCVYTLSGEQLGKSMPLDFGSPIWLDDFWGSDPAALACGTFDNSVVVVQPV